VTTCAARWLVGRCSWCAGQVGAGCMFSTTLHAPGRVVCRTRSGNAKSSSASTPGVDSEGRCPACPGGRYGDKLDWRAALSRWPGWRATGVRVRLLRPDVQSLATTWPGPGVPGSGHRLAEATLEIIKAPRVLHRRQLEAAADEQRGRYHALPTHDTYFKYLGALGTDLSGGCPAPSTTWVTGMRWWSTRRRGPADRQVEPLFGEHARDEIAGLRPTWRPSTARRGGPDGGHNRNMLIFPNWW